MARILLGSGIPYPESIIVNTEPIATKYRITVTNASKTGVLTNITPPTKGVAVGETFIYNGVVIFWDGAKWIDVNGEAATV